MVPNGLALSADDLLVDDDGVNAEAEAARRAKLATNFMV
jgi:hypothetical protein